MKSTIPVSFAKPRQSRNLAPSRRHSRRTKLGSGDRFFWFIIANTALAVVGGFSILGFRGWGWCWLTALGLSVLVLISPGKKKMVFPWALWIPFFLYVAWRTDIYSRNDMQRFGILLTPIVVAMASSSLPVRKLHDVQKAYYCLCWFILAAYMLAVLQSGSRYGAKWFALPGMCMTLTLISVGACVDWARGLKRGYVALCVTWGVCLLSESRMPVLAIPLLFLIGPWRITLRTRLICIAVVFVAGLAFFNTQSVQSNIFRQGEGTLEDLASFDAKKISSGGRLALWPMYFDAIEDFWFGAGGTASATFGLDVLRWRGHPHNEYLRLLFDYGIIGLILFWGPVIYLLVLCYGRCNKAPPPIQWLYRVGAGGILALFLLAITGNVIMYVAWFSNLLFATIGVALRASSTTLSVASRNTKRVRTGAHLAALEEKPTPRRTPIRGIKRPSKYRSGLNLQM